LKEQTTNANEQLKKSVLEYCKKLQSFSHAPVSLSHYKRMEKFASDKALVQSVFAVLKNCGIPPNDTVRYVFTVKDYYYSIALISIAEENRTEHLDFLQRTAHSYIKEGCQSIGVLHRNMLRLCKDYPDLLPIKEILDTAV
jgi:predicted translin family RNA/ssDNA-binding protein